MGDKIFSIPIDPGKLKSVGRTMAAAETAAAAEMDQNNKSPGYPGWQNESHWSCPVLLSSNATGAK